MRSPVVAPFGPESELVRCIETYLTSMLSYNPRIDVIHLVPPGTIFVGKAPESNASLPSNLSSLPPKLITYHAALPANGFLSSPF